MTRVVGMPKELGMGFNTETAIKGDPYKAVAKRMAKKAKTIKRTSVFAATRKLLFSTTSGIATHVHGAMYAKLAGKAYVTSPTGRLVRPEKVRQEMLMRALEAGHRLGKTGISFEEPA